MKPSLNDIPPVCVPLNYSYQNETAGDSPVDDTGYIGRDELVADLITILKHTRSTRGCYLVAGYRGTGKTSLVNRALHFYINRRTTPQWLSLGLERNKDYRGLVGIFWRFISAFYYFIFMLTSNIELNRHRSILSAFGGAVLKLVMYFVKIVKNIKFIKRYAIAIHINLGNDKLLKSDQVMYNTAILLNETYRRNIRLRLHHVFLKMLLFSSILYFSYYFVLPLYHSNINTNPQSRATSTNKVVVSNQQKSNITPVIIKPKQIVASTQQKTATKQVIVKPKQIVSSTQHKTVTKKVIVKPKQIVASTQQKTVTKQVNIKPKQIVSSTQQQAVINQGLKKSKLMAGSTNQKIVINSAMKNPKKIVVLQQQKPVRNTSIINNKQNKSGEQGGTVKNIDDLNNAFQNWLFFGYSGIASDQLKNILSVYNVSLWIIIFGITMIFYILVIMLLSFFGWWPDRIKMKLHGLSMRAKYTHELTGGIKTNYFNFGRKRHSAPLNAAQIETELINILVDIRNIPRVFGQADVIFIFDELDKISSSRNSSEEEGIYKSESVIKIAAIRKANVENLLSSIKSFITTGKARFFFIAGREVLDSYQSERGSTSSLYESLFNKIFEVNSLLTDPSDGEKNRLSSLVECYLCRRLLNPKVATYLWLLDQYSDPNSSLLDLNGKEQGLINKKMLLYFPFKLTTYYQYLCFSGIESREARRIILCLRNFISFLTIHSWGNCKRLNSLFEHFLKPHGFTDPRADNSLSQILYGRRRKRPQNNSEGDKTPQQSIIERIKFSLIKLINGKAYLISLQFGIIDQQRIMLTSNLSILLHHHLSRELSASGDKLVVSTFAILQYILKFHRLPFSRNQLERMDEVLNIYRSPDINSMTDTLLSKVLRLHCRRIRNSFYRYRFNSGFEQEIRYISHVSDIESAAFNFSLDSSAAVKQYYKERIARIRETRGMDGEHALRDSDSIFSDYYLALGDLYLSEQSYELAIECFQLGIDTLEPGISSILPATKGPPAIVSIGKRVFQYVEALLKLGDANERRQRYDRAAIAYLSAIDIVNKIEHIVPITDNMGSENRNNPEVLKNFIQLPDSKWEVFRQPFWALLYLNLKRSPIPWHEKLKELDEKIERDNSQDEENKNDGQKNNVEEKYLDRVSAWISKGKSNNIQTLYRLGKAALFFENTDLAIKYLSQCIDNLSDIHSESERDGYLIGMSCSAFGEVILMEIASNTKPNNCIDQLLYLFGKVPDGSTITIEMLITNCMPANNLYDIVKNRFINKSDNSTDDIQPKGSILLLVIGIILKGARCFESSSLYSQASFSCLNALSILSIYTEQIALLSELEKESNSTGTNGSKLSTLESWIMKTTELREEIRWMCLRNLSYAHGRSYFHFLQFHVEHDIKSLKSVDDENKSPLPLVVKMFYNNISSRIGINPEEIQKLPYFIKNLFAKDNRNTQLFKETAFWEHSLVAQKLAMVSIWHELSYDRIKRNSCGSTVDNLFEDIELRNLPPSSVRSLIFGCWHEAMKEFKNVTTIIDDSTLEAKKKSDSIYNCAANSVYNFFKAQHYIRQLCGNDQEIMFPPPGLIIYHMWRFFHKLYDFEKGLKKYPSNEFDSFNIITDIYDQLKVRTCTDVQNSFLDFAYVTERAIRYLKDLESIGDLSSRVRHEVLKTKYYLGDDHEDTRFTMDWTALHLFSPIAKLLRDHVEDTAKSEKILSNKLGV